MKHEIEHLDGIPWYEAPPPPRDHEHWAQSWGWTGPVGLDFIQRCACGAFGDGRGHWDFLDDPRVAPEEEVGRRDVLLAIALVALLLLTGWLASWLPTP